MIEKMNFISIAGPRDDIDRMVNVYLNRFEIHLENALSELSDARDLRPFVEINPYKEVLSKADNMVHILGEVKTAPVEISIIDAVNTINETHQELDEINHKIQELKDARNHLAEQLPKIRPFRMLNFDLRKMQDFKFIKFRFGRISHEYFQKFSKYIYDNLNTVFYECYNDKDYIYGIYFVPATNQVQVNTIYNSLHFEAFEMPDEYEGTPEDICNTIQTQITDLEEQIKLMNKQSEDFLKNHEEDIISARNELRRHNDSFDIRKMAAVTVSSEVDSAYYILCGWMSFEDTDNFITATKKDKKVTVIVDNSQEVSEINKPPTKLKNPAIFRPFEMFVNMYGLPAYNEIDPTIFVALTYSFIFGAMFGDVGQGLCLVVGGFLFSKYKKMALAAVISLAGIFSTFFGFMYGSLFGYEHVLPTYWLKPMENVMTVLVVAVGLGVVLILVAIILNIINAIRAKDMEKLLFDSNGIAGLLFYAGVVGSVVGIFMGYALPSTIILAILLGLPILAMFLKEPLTHLVERKSKILPDSKVMFFIEALVELFDILLTYATNTISFLRVGAFALSHAGMMGVVLMLGGAESGNTNWIIIILGNILVAGMEGLIVGIQVLRLEYYEMFGRFYRGTGKEFNAFKHK